MYFGQMQLGCALVLRMKSIAYTAQAAFIATLMRHGTTCACQERTFISEITIDFHAELWDNGSGVGGKYRPTVLGPHTSWVPVAYHARAPDVLKEWK